jgi:hypothetical protein
MVASSKFKELLKVRHLTEHFLILCSTLQLQGAQN